MRLAAAIAVSFALHAATLALASGSIGHLGRHQPPPATVALTVSLVHAEATGPQSSEPVVVGMSGEHSPDPAPPSSSADSTPLPDQGDSGIILPVHFPADALTRLPEALTDLDALLPRNTEPPPGRVELRAWLNRDGLIERLEVLRSEGPDGLTKVAVNAFARMRFRPGEIRGTPVGSQADIVVEFAASRPAAPAEAVSRPPARLP